jgi:hypothetical protein
MEGLCGANSQGYLSRADGSASPWLKGFVDDEHSTISFEAALQSLLPTDFQLMAYHSPYYCYTALTTIAQQVSGTGAKIVNIMVVQDTVMSAVLLSGSTTGASTPFLNCIFRKHPMPLSNI